MILNNIDWNYPDVYAPLIYPDAYPRFAAG